MCHTYSYLCYRSPDDVNGLVDWMIGNFNQTYLTNKAPFGFYVHAAWFDANEIHFKAYVKFIDYLQQLNDVYLVQLIYWIVFVAVIVSNLM